MRAAPAVDAALGPARVERLLVTVLHAVAGAAVAVWAAAHAWAGSGSLAPVWMPALAGALLLGVTGFCLARRALPGGPAHLCWDGMARQLRSGTDLAPLQRVVVAMDLGTWVLLQLLQLDGQRPSWRVANASGVGAAWQGLRVALQAHAGDRRVTVADSGDRP